VGSTGVDKRVLIAIGVVVVGVAGLMAVASSRLKAQQAQTAEAQRKQVALATRLGAEALETKRKQSVASGVAAGRVIVSKEGACDSPEAVSDAWSSLKLARAGDAEWAEASTLLAKLEPCQQRIAKQAALAAEAAQKKAALDAEGARKKAAATAAANAMTGRLAWASASEKKMLENGMEVDFIVTGSKKDLLTVKWVLMSKVQVYRLTNDDSMAEGSFLSNLQKAGFRKVTFSDGYNYGVTYTLPQSD
jgi:hypothetical protein